MIEEFMQNWTDLANKPDYDILSLPIQSGVKTMGKYFGMATRSSAQIMNLCELRIYLPTRLLNPLDVQT